MLFRYFRMRSGICRIKYRNSRLNSMKGSGIHIPKFFLVWLLLLWQPQGYPIVPPAFVPCPLSLVPRHFFSSSGNLNLSPLVFTTARYQSSLYPGCSTFGFCSPSTFVFMLPSIKRANKKPYRFFHSETV